MLCTQTITIEQFLTSNSLLQEIDRHTKCRIHINYVLETI